MFVPGRRLLLLAGAVVVPAATVGGVVPEAALPAAVLVAGVAVLAALDLVSSLGLLDGLVAEFPSVLRLAKDQPADVALTIRDASSDAGAGSSDSATNASAAPARIRSRPLALRVALPFPRDLPPRRDLVSLEGPPPGGSVVAEWRVTPRRRGVHLLEACHVETPSRMGLWDLRATLPTRGEIRVHPNLASERRSMATLFLNRGGVGAHAVRQIGKGHEFEKLREYVPGDSYEDLHWKATARRGKPITKVHQVERTQEVYVAIDASRLAAREVVEYPDGLPLARPASRPTSRADGSSAEHSRDEASRAKDDPVADDDAGVESLARLSPGLERTIRAALLLGLAAERQGDRYGLIVFSDRVETFVRAGAGREHHRRCREALLETVARPVSPDFEEVFGFLRSRVHRRSLVVFLTCLDDPALADSFAESLELVARRHVVLAAQMAPPAARPLFTGEPPADSDAIHERLAGHLAWESMRRLELALRTKGARFASIPHEGFVPELVASYMSIKRRQLL